MSPERLEKFKEIERREKELHDSFGVVDSEMKLAAKISAMIEIHKDVWGDELVYNKEAVNKEIKRDPKIARNEARMIHALLKGRKVGVELWKEKV